MFIEYAALDYNDENYIIFITTEDKFIRIPKSEFTSTWNPPDFSKIRIIDYGQTVAFGTYEVESNWIVEYPSSSY